VYEGHLHFREACEDVGFGEGGIEALVGDAVAVKDHAVSILEIEGGLRESGGQGERQNEREDCDTPKGRHDFFSIR
jgi:hypothetical protein